MIGESPGQVPFEAHVELLRLFLAQRKAVVERIERLLNAKRRPIQYLQDRSLLSRQFEDCFFTLTAVTGEQSRLRGQLEEAHWESGFRPRQVRELFNDLVNPAEMMIRGFFFWQQTRWPGRNGRIRYAQMLFNLYVLRSLEFLSLRLWDAGSSSAGDRLARAQALLDALWDGSPTDLPALVRDARWLIPLAQSPTTDELGAYFEVQEEVADTLAARDRLEVQRAGVVMIAGHLRSQLRHYTMKDDLPFDEPGVVRRTRTSNALDFALLIQGLVPLLEAYEQARQSGDTEIRLEMARAICQGISPDPELFLNRIDLLGAYSMIEQLFVMTDGAGQAVYTPMGQRHVRLFREYEARIGRATRPLLDDCQHFRPSGGTYSPYGAIYGTPSNLTEDMALKTLQLDVVTDFSLEDVFIEGDADKLAWVDGWRKLPHIDREVQGLYAYPQQFAEDIFDRIEHALRRCGSAGQTKDTPRTGRLFISPGNDLQADAKGSAIADLPAFYSVSSDPQIVAARRAESHDQMQLLRGRQEGYFAVSFETPGGWLAIKKDFLTEILGAGRDARVAGLPPAGAAVLSLMCPDLVVQESAPPSMLKA